MALPSYILRAGTAASQVLQGYDQSTFEKILLSQYVCIAFDEQATKSQEGQFIIDLTIRLVARLYPNVEIRPLVTEAGKYKNDFEVLAKSINKDIDLAPQANSTVFLVIGAEKVKTDKPVFYLGSDKWYVKFSDKKPEPAGDSSNPFGAGAAACFGAANLFRKVFEAHLPFSSLDTEFSLSLIDYVVNPTELNNPVIKGIDIGEVHLIGAGAIGNAFVWGLSRASGLKGSLFIVDEQKVDEGNLQRYVLTNQESADQGKVKIAEAEFSKSDIVPVAIPNHWGPYIETRNNWNIEFVAVGVDTAEARIAIQSSLPKNIINSWTQTNDLGVSRHFNFIDSTCLACLYMPSKPKPHISEEVANNLGLPKPDGERVIRDYLAQNLPVDVGLLQRISIAKSIPIAELQPFIGMQLMNFYSEVVCGKMLLSFQEEGKINIQSEVPLAFQSALAGIMMAAEVVIHKGQLRKVPIKNRSRFNLLKPMTKYINEGIEKFVGGNCFCQDEDYLTTYRNKYS